MSLHRLFRRSRIRLALWYSLVMGGILSLSAYAVYRSIVQSNWSAMDREIESIAGTLHDSLEPMLPATGDPTVVLQQIVPDLCLVGHPCTAHPTLIQRHTTGVSDRSVYYLRLFDHRGELLAFSPNHPVPLPSQVISTPWQTIHVAHGQRYRQFTTLLHGAGGKGLEGHSHDSWGYLQVGRTLVRLDAETQRIQWILWIGLPITLLFVALSSWGLSGLAMQPIYQSYQQQQQFIANAAHELRSPMASLLATVEAIRRVSPATAHRLEARPSGLHGSEAHPSETHSLDNSLKTLERQGHRLGHLVNDLLLLSSLEQHTPTLLFQPCNLNDLVSDLAEEFLELAIAHRIQLMSQLPNQAIYVLGDESQLYRLVTNLITNAIHYTPAGGEIRLRLNQRDRMALITIQDSGIGIPAADLPKIFERFYRVDSDRSRHTGGAGLGLAIVQAIARHHKGVVTVVSAPHQGSTFTVQLPIMVQKR